MVPCRLIRDNIIPREELRRVFSDSKTACAELDASFLCFDDVYEKVLSCTEKSMTILDLGCAYAPQCWYFKDYARYIGVDLPFGNNVRFKAPNSEFYLCSIQKFLQDKLPRMDIDLGQVFAVCSYVPDREAQKLVIKTFPNHLVYYPGVSGICSFSIQQIE